MPLEFIYLNSPLLSQSTVTTEKLWGKKNDTKQNLKNSQKMIAQSLEKRKNGNGKMEIKL